MANNNNKKTPPKSSGQRRLKDYLVNNNFKAVAVALPRELHRVLDRMVAEAKGAADTARPTTIHALVTVACSAYYSDENVKTLPPLAQFEPPRPNADGKGDRRFTWYADMDLFRSMKIISARHSCSLRQLIVSAVLERYKDTPQIKALGMETSGDPRWRMPSATD